jgi:hypothetical protein
MAMLLRRDWKGSDGQHQGKQRQSCTGHEQHLSKE